MSQTLPVPPGIANKFLSVSVLKSGSLNLLEPSGPVQACNGTYFTFLSHFFLYYSLLCNLFKKNTFGCALLHCVLIIQLHQ
jgi:hypothetical protein